MWQSDSITTPRGIVTRYRQTVLLHRLLFVAMSALATREGVVAWLAGSGALSMVCGSDISDCGVPSHIADTQLIVTPTISHSSHDKRMLPSKQFTFDFIYTQNHNLHDLLGRLEVESDLQNSMTTSQSKEEERIAMKKSMKMSFARKLGEMWTMVETKKKITKRKRLCCELGDKL
jgi:hypothetical protein